MERGTPLLRHVWRLGLLGGLTLVILVLVAQFCIAISPMNGTPSNPSDVATAFFQSYLALPVFLLSYIVGYAWKRTTPQWAHQIDLDVSQFLFLLFRVLFNWGGVLTALSNMYCRPAVCIGTPSSRCATTAPSLLPSQYGRRLTASPSRLT